MPAINPPVSKARFDDDAIERLESLLIEECIPFGGLPLEVVDGLFSGALVAPGDAFTLEELLPVIYGERTEPVSEALSGLLEMMWHATLQRIARGPSEDYSACMPLVALPPMDDEELKQALANSGADAESESTGDDEEMPPVGSGWALGFMLSYDLRAGDWEARLDEDDEGAQGVMDILSLLPDYIGDDEEDEDAAEDASEDADLDRGEEDELDLDALIGDTEIEPITFAQRLDVIASLPAILQQFHRSKINELTPRTPVRREDAPGRNDPCPCGSGQKYKKCHGDTHRLN